MSRMKAGKVMAGVLAAALGAGASVVEPKNTDEILTNPGMGICHFYYSSRIWAYGAASEPGDTLDWMPGTSVIYMRLPWCYLEPEEGVFRWDILDSKARPWIAAGKKIAFRISCMDPTLCSIPDWAIRAGIRGSESHYRDNPKNALIFEPVWDDPVLIEKVTNFYRAFAARYDGNPDVAFVDLGSFGLYGEGHAPKLGKIRESDPAEYDRLCRLHLDLLRKALPRTYLVVSEDIAGGGWIETDASAIGTTPNPFTPGGKPRLYDHPILAYARSIGYGLRDDSIMCNAQRPWGSDHFGRLFARETPVVIESGHLSKRLQTKSWRPELLRKCIEEYHASYISTHGFPEIYWKTNKDVWSDFANRLGYRFELRRVEYPDTVKVSEKVSVKSTWVNVGVAPQYANASLTWNLLNEKGVVCWSVTDPKFGFRSLPPKLEDGEKPVEVVSPCTFGYTAQVPNNGNDAILNWCIQNNQDDPGKTVALLKPGVYTLAVSVGRNDGKPEIALPLEGGIDRVYPVGKVTVADRDVAMKGLLLCGTVAAALCAGAGESATNLDFSNGPKDWIMDGRMWTVDPTSGRGGSPALVYDNADTNAYSFPFQRVTVEGGGVYKFGAWVKVDRLEHCGKPTKACVYFDWNDRDGKFLGAAWGRPVVHNLANTDGWEYFEGQTPVLPSQAVLGKLAAVVPRGRVGRARVDDFMFRPLGTKSVEFIASSRYRDEGWTGTVDFHVLQHVNTVRHPLSTLRAEFAYTSADGERCLRPTVFTADEAGASIAVADLAMGTHPVRYVLRTADGKTLGSAICLFTRLAADPRRRCYLDEHKRLIVDGKRFFPLGLYYYHASFDPASPEMKRYLEGPFNTILPYSTLRPEQYDALGRAGLKVICPATGLVRSSLGEKPGCGTKEGADRVLSARINEVKGVPALIAWYDIDEAPAKQVEPLMEARETFHREDPDHPVWGVTDKPYDLRMFTRAMDIVGVDPYPIGNHPERGDIGLCADWSFEARSNMWDAVACWHVPQAFNWKNDRPNVPNPDHRFPTKEEFANMCYQLIAAGANGLIPFSYTGATSEENDRPCGWQRVCEVFAEIRDRTDLFLSDPGPAVVSAPQGVVARTWRTDAGLVKTLVVNKTRADVTGTVRLADGTSHVVDLKALGSVIR